MYEKLLEVQDVELINKEQLHWLQQLKNKRQVRFTGYSLIDIHCILYEDYKTKHAPV